MAGTVARVAGEAVLAYVIEKVIDKLFDPNTTLGPDLIESIMDLSLSILEGVENYTPIPIGQIYSPFGQGGFNAYWTYADLNTKKRFAYKLEQTFHASMIALSPDDYWSQIQSVFGGQPSEKSKQVRKRAKALAIAICVRHLVIEGWWVEEAYKRIAADINIDQRWDV